MDEEQQWHEKQVQWAQKMRAKVFIASNYYVNHRHMHLDQSIDYAWITAQREQEERPGIPCAWCRWAKMSICETCQALARPIIEQWILQLISDLETGANK